MIKPTTRSKGRLISSPRIRFSSVQFRSGEVRGQKYQDPSRTLDRCPTHAHTQSASPANRARREGEREPSRSIYMHAALHGRAEQSRGSQAMDPLRPRNTSSCISGPVHAPRILQARPAGRRIPGR
jgi:hypothetical protein